MKLLRHLPRFRQAYLELPILARRESWSREQIETFQLERLNRVWQVARSSTAYYGRLAAAHRLPERFASLTEYQARMPALHKPTLQANRLDLLAARPGPGSWRVTGGSTGSATKVFWNAEAARETLRARYRFYESWGIDLLERVAFLWGHRLSYSPGLAGMLQRLREPLEDWLRSRLRLSAYHLSPEVLRDYLRQMRLFRPSSLYSYSSAAYLLAREGRHNGQWPRSVRLVTLTGEPAYPHMVADIEQSLRVPAVVEYGCIECGLLANEWPDRKIHVREDLVFLETRPRSDGRHDILVSVLYNPSYPLLRYEVGDVTDAPLERPAVGFAVLSNIVGRSNDLLLAANGDIVHPFLLEGLLELDQLVRRWRIHQLADGSVELTIQPADPAQPPDLRALEGKFRAVLRGYPVRGVIVSEMAPSPAGKHRYVTSELTPALNRTRPRGVEV